MTHRFWRLAYDVALLAFPRAFRARWGGDMRLTFLARMNAGSLSHVQLTHELHNVVAAGLRERLSPNTMPMRVFHPQDIRYAVRLLLRSPVFTLMTVLVLAGGLGLSTFTFSFLHTAMIAPLPLGDGDRIVRVAQEVDGRRRSIDAADVEPLRGSVRTIEELGAYVGRELVVGEGTNIRIIDGTVTDPVLFSVARTPAWLGRALLPSDAQDGAEPVIVLSYRTWDVAFGADRALINQFITINGARTRVVGVMPEGYGFPVSSESWIPLPLATTRNASAGLEAVNLVGRLAPGANHAQAEREVAPVLQRLISERDKAVRPEAIGADVDSFPSVQFGEERMLVFTVLNLLAALILLLALVNVTNLLLARANERIRETAVRLALGASAGRLVVQGMWETILLCVFGGVVGTAGASWGLDAITRWTQANMEGNLAFWWVWHMDRTTVIGAGAFVTVAIAVLGSVVALRATRTNVREVLQDGSARSGSRREGRLSRILVTTQVTTVTILMFVGVVAGVVARRVVNLDPGYDVTNLLQGGIEPPAARYATAAARGTAYRNIHARLAEHRALDRVYVRYTMADKESEAGRFARRDANVAVTAPTAHVQAVLGDGATLGIRIVEGRPLAASDDTAGAPVAVISQALAERHWRGRSPIGDQVRLASVGDTSTWRTIVGVASDVPYGNALARDRSAEAIYVSLLQVDAPYAVVIARYRAGEIAGRAALLQSYMAFDPLMPPTSVQPFAEVLRKVGLIATSTSTLFGWCFAFALLLAIVGTYGLMARSIGQRQREIGVRRALGATDGKVTRLLLNQGARQLGVGTVIAAPLLAGIAIGVAQFFPLGAWLATGLAAGVSLSIIAVVLAATWLPTRRILRVTPRDALWSE